MARCKSIDDTSTKMIPSSEHIIENAVQKMKSIFIFHVSVMLLITSLQICCGFKTILPICFVVFCNTICLAERFWHVQLTTLIHWPIETRGVFVASRLLTVTVTTVLLSVAVKIILRL